MTYIQNLFTSRDNNAQGNTYVGQEGRIWWDPDRNALYYSDGNTAGGIAVGTGGGGPGVPGGPTNSVQFNAGGGSFGGTANLVIAGTGLSAVGNITAAWFIGNVSATGNIVGGNILSNNYLYANGSSIFANIALTGNVNLGNLYVTDQTIGGTNLNANIILFPEGSGWVVTPKIVIDGMTIANTGTVIEINTPATVGVQFNANNIFADGNILPTANNISSLGNATNRYTDLWVGSGNINIVDQTLSQNQQIYADNGNLIIANSSGLTFGNFRFYGNAMFNANSAANIQIGQVGDTGWLQVDRPLAVDTTGGQTAFSVDSAGRTQIRAFDGTPANSAGALNIVASSDGAYQNVTNSGGLLHLTGPTDSAARMTVDAFGTQGGSGSPGVLVFRSARGNASTPTATQANDTLARISAVGWGNTPGFGAGATLAATAVEFVALETFTPTAQGTKITFNTADTGANSRSVSATIQANGVSFLNNTTANSGITFRDGTFQNTAYSATNTVGSATAATGISIAPTNTSAVGNITITNTGVITTAGTANQVFVNGANVISPANGAVTLSLPQDIAQGSNVQFYSLTVTDLSITGNVSNVIPSVVSGKIVYVANTATTSNDINLSGLVTGNAANGFYAGILYQTTGAYANTWDLSIGNSIGIFAANIYGEEGQFDNMLHVGFANATIDFPDASIQADCDIDSYNQVVIMNHNQGANASGDFVAVANNGDDGNFYIDMGINSNVYNNSDYAVTGPNDGYMYVNGGNLVIGTQTPAKVINFFTGGTNSTSYIGGTLSDTGLSMVGNVTANNFIGNSLATTNGISATGTVTGGNIVSLNTVSAAGNITGQNLLTTGIVSATGNITGGNIRTGGSITATGNIRGGNLITATTVINAGISTSGNVTANNIIVGSLSASGNITGTNVIAANTVIGDTISVLGNVTGGNLLTSGVISTTGNAIFGNISTTGRAIVTGNVDAGNLRTLGLLSATGNIGTAGYFIGDGGLLSNITVLGANAFGNMYANGTAVLAGTSSATLTLTPGNNQVITGNNTSKTVTIAVNDNPTFGNISVTGNITVNGNIQTANTTYLANVGNILFSNIAPLPPAQPGVMEFDGRVLYFTAQDQERGVLPSQQWYVLNADRGLTYASTTPQSLFGVGVHVSNSTRYHFRIKTTVSRSSGTNNTAFTLGWRGSATPLTITYEVNSSIGTVSTPKVSYQFETELVSNFTNQVTVTTTSNPPDSVTVIISGIIDVGAAGVGYLEPFISWTGVAAPGSVVVESLSSFWIYPIGVTGSNTNVGNWA